jgi:hypothetical protein
LDALQDILRLPGCAHSSTFCCITTLLLLLLLLGCVHSSSKLACRVHTCSRRCLLTGLLLLLLCAKIVLTRTVCLPRGLPLLLECASNGISLTCCAHNAVCCSACGIQACSDDAGRQLMVGRVPGAAVAAAALTVGV